ncbi:MAG: hypothetical protein QG551_345 [Patescibacteria group bacterium]|mgnify:CR=1 FL=1|jgi:hypothetical protein|nr:hypothetical protein [Patescibacteria group bacterium]MDQ5953117.1 hypothetical protein [Patescibacteria group bacterium]
MKATIILDLGSHKVYVNETLKESDDGQTIICEFYIEDENLREVWRSDLSPEENTHLEGKIREHIERVAKKDLPKIKLGEKFTIWGVGIQGAMWMTVDIQKEEVIEELT